MTKSLASILTLPPSVSIIVPTRDRVEVLPYLFESLARLSYPAERVELIVVDDASNDGTPKLLERWQDRLPFPMRIVRGDGRGPAAARNHGAAIATGEFLAFTDSDCQPVSGWLDAALARVENDSGVICGPLTPIGRPGGPGLLSAQIGAVRRDNGTYPTANLVVRRSAFIKVGGFDETFGLLPWGELAAGEDADLAWRIRRSGFQASFRPEAEVKHLATRVSPLRLLLKPARLQCIPRLVRAVPELRRTYLWRGYFLSRSRAEFHLACVGIGAAVLCRRWPLALGAAPWLYGRLKEDVLPVVRRAGPVRGFAWLGLIVAIEAVSTATLVFGSLRHRRVVL